LTRSGKICGLRSGIGTTGYDTWTMAWARAGLRGAPLHLSTHSTVQLSCSRRHAPSLFRTHRFYWRPLSAERWSRGLGQRRRGIFRRLLSQKRTECCPTRVIQAQTLQRTFLPIYSRIIFRIKTHRTRMSRTRKPFLRTAAPCFLARQPLC